MKLGNLLLFTALIVTIKALAMNEIGNVDNLNVKIPNFENKFNLLQYNVDQAVREEKFENTKWKNRSPLVRKLIDEVSADIVCLQEMRKLPDNPSIEKFLADFDNYRSVVFFRNPSEMAFGQAILYNQKKFFLVNSFQKWLSDNQNEVSDTFAQKSDAAWGSTVVCAKFLPIHNGKVIKNAKPLWVFNTHFALDEIVKTKSCYKLLEIVKEIANSDPYIVCGDFNFFPDKDGSKQRAILATVMKDLGKGAVTLGGRLIEGTFVGYEHDEFKADLNNMISRLDHIWGSKGVETEGPVVLYTKTMKNPEPKELTTRDLPSDHLPLKASIKILTSTIEGQEKNECK